MSTSLVLLLLVAAMPTALPTPVRKQLRWYVGNPAHGDVESFLLGDNPSHLANTTARVDDITGGVYQCCSQFRLNASGQLQGPAAPGYNTSAWAGLDMFVSIAAAANCTAASPTPGCVTPGDICSAALARGSAFVDEVLAMTQVFALRGINLDWEFGYGNNVSCFSALWGSVAAALHARNQQLAISIDDSAGRDFSPNATAWAYEWDWIYDLDFADILINMGLVVRGFLKGGRDPGGGPVLIHPPSLPAIISTYPGAWSQGISFPANEFLKPYPCPGNHTRTCGVEGQVLDMRRLGADAAGGQLQPGLSMSGCRANSTTPNGWDAVSLAAFLDFLDTQEVRVVTIWTDDAMLLPESFSTCPWFVPTLRQWALR